ncbi:hypothetical protein MCEMRE185_01064 [Candidatus Nanopelagicaceae bacterium]
MKISILCNLNQARSPFGQAVLEHFFPEQIIQSAGIAAVDSTDTCVEVRLIAEEWKLPSVKPQSESIYTWKDHIVNSSLVIIAESSMEVPVRLLGFNGPCISLDDLRIDATFIPTDPLELSFQKFNLELAKVAYCSVQVMRIYLNQTNQNQILTVIPESEEDTAYAYAYSKLEQKITGGVIIDADFRAPASRGYSSDFDVEYLDVENFEKVDLSKIGPRTVLVPAREYGKPESILISNGWKSFLEKLSEIMPVYLISAPRQTEGKKLVDSYLCAIWSDKVTIINS